MPVPMMNIINGGAHADNSVDIQEFMVLPVGAPSFAEALRYGAEIFHTLKKVLHERGLATAVGDEGGFAPEPAVERGGARDDHRGGRARRVQGRPRRLPRARCRQLRVLPGRQLHTRIREPQVHRGAVRRLPRGARRAATRSSRSRTAWPRATGTAGRCSRSGSAKRVQLVGDDLFVTNTQILREGIARGIANAILIKPNQIGTLTETLAAIDMAAEAGYGAVVSHRSGETEDSTIADIAVATARHADQDRLAVPLGPHREVQPAAAHRGGARRRGELRRARGVSGAVPAGCA